MRPNDKKILILGDKGMLGYDLKKVFANSNLHVFDKEQLDITNKDAVFNIFEEIEPDIVLNVAAYTDVEGAEDARDMSMRVNGDAVGYLAEAAHELGSVLVHYSTDYVFSGDKYGGYSENSWPAAKPLNVYGISKLKGERLLRENTKKYYLIRTSWLFGENGKNFVETVLRLAKNGEMKIKNDEHGKPTYTKDLAQATRILVGEGLPFGTYHFTNENSTTWYDFAKKIVELWGQKQNWKRVDYPKIIPITSAEFPAKAKRPKYSVLNNTKFVKLRPWQEALAEYLENRG